MPLANMRIAKTAWSFASLLQWNKSSSRLLKRLNVGQCSKKIFVDDLPASFLMQCFIQSKPITY